MEQTKSKPKYFLMCERSWVYFTLIAIGGFLGVYTFLLRGHAFCNAQTGNIVMMGMALGSGNWAQAAYYIIPVSAYLGGTLASELLPNPIKRYLPIRWDTLLIAVEFLVVFLLGFVPDSAPVQITQISVNFIASMQYNTFRQAEGIPMSTTFVTNHIRQIGVGLSREIRHFSSPEKPFRKALIRNIEMLLFFILGAAVGTVFCNHLGGKAIWGALIPLGTIFIAFLHADLTIEKDLILKKPSGH